MDRHVALVTLLESFDLGKNTAQNAGIEVKVFGKGTAAKRGSQLGTIRIGQGSFAWWAKSAKVETKNGKRSPTLRLGWSEFAERMAELASEKPKPKPNAKPKKKKPTHAQAVAAVAKALN